MIQETRSLRMKPNAFVIFNFENGNAQLKFKCLPDSIDEIENIIFANNNRSKISKCKKFLYFILKEKKRNYNKFRLQEKSEQAINKWLCPLHRNQTSNGEMIPNHYGIDYFFSSSDNQFQRKIDLSRFRFRLKNLKGRKLDPSKYNLEQLSNLLVSPNHCRCKSAHWLHNVEY